MWVAALVLAMAVIETGDVSSRPPHLSDPDRSGVALNRSRNPEPAGKPKARTEKRIPWTDSNRVLFNLSGS